MPSLNNPTESFAFDLETLGGLINSTQVKNREYIDLELFFLNATTHILGSDTRLVRCMEYWSPAFGKYLSPVRLIKHIQSGVKFNSAVLGVLLSIADSKFPRSGEFKTIAQYCKKQDQTFLFPFFTHINSCDTRWKNFGIIAPKFLPDEQSHFIQSMEYVLKKIPELSYRIKGYSIAVANIHALLDINGPLSVYKIAKLTNSTYSYIHGVYNKHVKISRVA